MCLRLVENGLTNAAMFTADGEVVQAAEVLYQKTILVERGSFRPVTKVTIDMLECAQAQFVQEPNVQGEEIVVLMEMTMRNLTTEGGIDHPVQQFAASQFCDERRSAKRGPLQVACIELTLAV